MKKIPDKKFDTREIGSLADYEWEETERERNTEKPTTVLQLFGFSSKCCSLFIP